MPDAGMLDASAGCRMPEMSKTLHKYHTKKDHEIYLFE